MSRIAIIRLLRLFRDQPPVLSFRRLIGPVMIRKTIGICKGRIILRGVFGGNQQIQPASKTGYYPVVS